MNSEFDFSLIRPYGWDDRWSAQFDPSGHAGLSPARVAAHYRERYLLFSGSGETWGEVSGKFKYQHSSDPSEFPAIGDWVAMKQSSPGELAVISEVLPRRTEFSRRAAGAKPYRQVIAANMDFVMIVDGLDKQFKMRRLERYLLLATESGANPVVILNKIDCSDDPEGVRNSILDQYPSIPVFLMNALQMKGAELLIPVFGSGQTAVLIGPSGVGKTTIINSLTGSFERKTQEVREQDKRGRHTTTSREILILPSGGLIIDTPGMRELQLWDGAEGIDETFEDVENLVTGCRYRDCEHTESSAGCAVVAAVQSGEISQDRYRAYMKLRKEIAYRQEEGGFEAQRKRKESQKNIRKLQKLIKNRKL